LAQTQSRESLSVEAIVEKTTTSGRKPVSDLKLNKAIEQVRHTGPVGQLVVRSFFDEATNTASYVIHDVATKRGAIIDSVLDFDAAAGRISTTSADAMIAYAKGGGLFIDWLLETHAHADHLSAAPYIQGKMGGKLAIGREIIKVQNVFGKIFNLGSRATVRNSTGSSMTAINSPLARFR
jgi:glyoxylase-like metal-dependent hydrolase (beta-lactamase superfamily II)